MRILDEKRELEQNLNEEFDLLYQSKYRKLSSLHWTSYKVAIDAIGWLSQSSESKILDIGSGIGKFCILGALFSNGHYTGVEKRKNLVKEAIMIKDKVNVQNANFIHANIKEINFLDYNAFYHYNPFYEHVVGFGRIDESISFSKEKFNEYQSYVYDQFERCPVGTRIVTYCSDEFYLPKDYFLHEIKHNGRLLFWEKKSAIL